jgi:hypothetical protein
MTVYKGRVFGFMPRSESSVCCERTTLVWDFRLERTDAGGGPLPRIAAEMRGKCETSAPARSFERTACKARPICHLVCINGRLADRMNKAIKRCANSPPVTVNGTSSPGDL